MASHYIAIAKASLAAALLRPDPTSVGRDEIARFHTLLDEAINKCTPSNVQNCKTWLSVNVINSTGRTTALGKYLAALSTSFGKVAVPAASYKQDGPLPITPAAERSALKRKRLHLLYVLNDVFHHAKYHTGGSSSSSSLTDHLQPQLNNLFTLAGSFDREKNPRHHQRLGELLNLWEGQAYFPEDFISKLREAIKNAGASESGGSEVVQSLQAGDLNVQAMTAPNKDLVYIMPATHGDISIPYYDLPAGNMMPHINKNSTRPINPQRVKPLQFDSGPAKESLVSVVKDLLKEAESIYTVNDEGIVADIDEMGQRMVKDEQSGDFVVVDSYYGWSIEFCERMKKRKEAGSEGHNGGTGRGRSFSRSDSGGSSPHKRRRFSSSGSRRDRSRSRSQRGFRSQNRSRSRSPQREYRNGSRHAESRADSRPSSSPNRHRERSYSPPDVVRPSFLHLQVPHLAPSQFSNPPLHTPTAQIDNPIPSQPPAAPVPPPLSAYNHNFPIGPGGLPIPPPPSFHTGPWPPPPPSMPAGMTFNPAQYPGFSTVGFVPPPPPPPPPQSTSHTPYAGGPMQGQGHWQGQGRGGHGQWESRDTGRDGGGREWERANTSRGGGGGGGGSQEQWNRGHGGRGRGGDWRSNQDPRRRR